MAFDRAVGYHPTGERGPRPSPISNHHTDILRDKQTERSLTFSLTTEASITFTAALKKNPDFSKHKERWCAQIDEKRLVVSTEQFSFVMTWICG